MFNNFFREAPLKIVDEMKINDNRSNIIPSSGIKNEVKFHLYPFNEKKFYELIRKLEGIPSFLTKKVLQDGELRKVCFNTMGVTIGVPQGSVVPNAIRDIRE